MRKSKIEAAKTRQQIITTAASEFRGKGVEGVGLSDLMSKAGLTHGGFYRHFKTKDDLVSEALGFAFTASADKLDQTVGEMGLEETIADYLSEGHRDHRSEGCPFAALGSELARCEKVVRDKAMAGFLRQANIIANKLKGLPPAEAKKRAIVIMASIAGALNMSRVVTDPELSRSILRETARSLRFFAPGAELESRPSRKRPRTSNKAQK